MSKGVTSDRIKKLGEPLKQHELECRPGSVTKDKSKGMVLWYATARAIMDRLDQVCGPENWQFTFDQAPHDKSGTGVRATISILIDRGDHSEWVAKTDASDASDIEGVKGSVSGGMRRAAVHWGIARELYSLPSQWHKLKMGRYFDGTPKYPGSKKPSLYTETAPPEAVEKSPAKPATKKETVKKAEPKVTPKFFKEKLLPVGLEKGWTEAEVKAIYKKHCGGGCTPAGAMAYFVEELDFAPPVED